MNKVYVLGSLNIDHTIIAPRFPKIGETIEGETFYSAFGGKGANQAIASLRAGAETILIGCVGQDSFGQEYIDHLAEDGMNVKNIKTVEGETGTAVITIANHDNQIIIAHGANFKIEKQQVKQALSNANRGDFLIMQFEIELEIIEYAIKLAKEKEMIIIVNPAPCCYDISELYKDIDYLVPNETEYETLLNINNNKELGVKYLLITLGKLGSKLISSGEEIKVSAEVYEAIDTTAAGDTYIGYFAAGLAKGLSQKESMELASKASGIAVTRKGAIPSIPYINEII